MNSFIITSTGITLHFASDGSQHTVRNDHPEFDKICRLATSERFEEIKPLIDIVSTVREFVHESKGGVVQIDGSVLLFRGEELHSYLANRIVDMAQEGLDITAMENFLINLMDNSSHRAVNELYGFLEAGNLPITPDGHFLAYKRVRDDYTDVHSGKFDNSVGQIVEMPRNKVDEDRDRTCSTGLHFCSYDYLGCFGGSRVMVLKINPRDVVSIPSDYNDSKGRCCRYEVIREIHLTAEEEQRIEGLVSHDGTYSPRPVTADLHLELEFDEIDDEDEEECFDCGYDHSECECDQEEYLLGHDDDEEEDDGDAEWPNEDTIEIFVGYEDEQGDVSLWGDEDEDGTDDGGDLIRATNMKTNHVEDYVSVEDAHLGTGVPEEYINRVLRGDRGSSLGFRFDVVTVV